MLRWTDKYCRYFHRLFSKNILLYTEMTSTGAILHGDRERFLDFDPTEHPVALQLGGSNPKQLAKCTKIGADYGYDEINLNVGCPSGKVQAGEFGACLMLKPELVAECINAMVQTTNIPITVKTRLGIAGVYTYEKLHNFIKLISAAGCTKFIIHARLAKLTMGTSPKENRNLPLDYETVYQLKRDFPALQIIINGGIKTYAAIKEHLQHVDGVMIGREAYHNPYFLARIDQEFYGATTKPVSRENAFAAAPKQAARHMLGLYKGTPGAKEWRRVKQP